MNEVWQLTIDDYLAICEMAKKNGKKSGDSMEEELRQYMKEKKKNPIGNTELNKEEYINELVSHDKTILNIDENGTKIIKKKNKGEEK